VYVKILEGRSYEGKGGVESGVDMSVAEKTRDTPCDIRDKTEQR
jgi:hypothetical protein